MELIALLSTGEGSWAQVNGLMKHGDWEKIVLVGDDAAKTFTHEKAFEFVKIDTSKRLLDLRDDLKKKLAGKFEEMEVACSIASGNGKEHMALCSAVLGLPMGIRFVALTKSGVTYL
ncbi:MAG: hypothetical protein PF542_01615 [Nanoarchaeota archaeon]|jgi:hypothetical protein|nr:hypothetical protein [Nanoarchaeota archaeon]